MSKSNANQDPRISTRYGIVWRSIRYIRPIMTAHLHDQDNLSVEQIEGIKAMKFNNNDANGSLK